MNSNMYETPWIYQKLFCSTKNPEFHGYEILRFNNLAQFCFYCQGK